MRNYGLILFAVVYLTAILAPVPSQQVVLEVEPEIPEDTATDTDEDHIVTHPGLHQAGDHSNCGHHAA